MKRISRDKLRETDAD